MWIIGVAILCVVLLVLIVLKIKKWKKEGFGGSKASSGEIAKIHEAVQKGAVDGMRDTILKSYGTAVYIKLAQEANMIKLGVKGKIPRSHISAIVTGKDAEEVLKK
nr:hypothetical protein K-LCC10_0414 [Kaumoebavirus]